MNAQQWLQQEAERIEARLALLERVRAKIRRNTGEPLEPEERELLMDLLMARKAKR